MLVLGVIFMLVAVGAWVFYKDKDGSIKMSQKGKKIALIIFIVAVILAVLFIILDFADDWGSSGSSNSWDDLTEEEKDWYRDNYGGGKSQQYDDAISGYKGYGN